jgi:KDO2-lipid IV(A) lauroyltransferase
MYRLYHFASIVVPRLPRGLVTGLSQFIGLMAWLIAVRARKQATANMRHVPGFQEQATRSGRRKLRRTVRKMFQNNARNYLETLYLPHLKREELMQRIIYKGGLEHLDDALALGKGVILLSVHMGPFDYIVQWFAFQNYALTVPVEHLKDERMLELALKLRRVKGLQFVPLGGSTPLRAMMQALRNNQLVLLTFDRAVQGEIVERPFFGSPARFPIGAISLALRTGAPIVAGFGWYEARGQMGAHLIPVTLAMKEEDRQDPDKLLQKFVEIMEENIQARPDQWVLFAPIWTNDVAVK